jgi:hypothetical protein
MKKKTNDQRKAREKTKTNNEIYKKNERKKAKEEMNDDRR